MSKIISPNEFQKKPNSVGSKIDSIEKMVLQIHAGVAQKFQELDYALALIQDLVAHLHEDLNVDLKERVAAFEAHVEKLTKEHNENKEAENKDNA